jgi:hypothetical protein
VTTPIPNLRRPEWLDRLIRQGRETTRDRLSRRNRRRTIRSIITWAAGVLAVAACKFAIDLMALRMGWVAPPGRSGERMGAERVEK